MTDTSTPKTTKQSGQKRSPNGFQSFLILVFRLLLLGVGGAFAWIVGMAIVYFAPAQTTEPPLAATLLQQWDQLQARFQGSETSPTDDPNPSSPLSEGQNALMVTLPSDVLFEAGGTNFRPQSQLLLDNIVSDLQQHPNATIRIAAHTDDQEDGTTNRLRSLSQAQAIQQYLAESLGNQHHWSIVGYGQSRPLAPNDSAENRQRNRRIEISIDLQ